MQEMDQCIPALAEPQSCLASFWWFGLGLALLEQDSPCIQPRGYNTLRRDLELLHAGRTQGCKGLLCRRCS